MSEGRKKENPFSVLKSLSTLSESIHSDIGKVNISASMVIAIVILSISMVPIAFYILYGLLIVCNTVLSYFGLDPLSLGLTAPPWWLLLICVAVLVLESFICLKMVTYSEQKKKELGLNKEPEDPEDESED